MTPGARPLIGGCCAAIPTFFTAAGAVDSGATSAHAERLAAAGIEAIWTCGTTGEFLFLTDRERNAVTAAAAATGVPVAGGAWSLSAAAAGSVAAAAGASGAAAAFLAPPIYHPIDDEAVGAWYASVAAAVSGLPLFAYHIPRYAVNGISVDLAARLTSEGVLAGLKDSSGDMSRLPFLRAALPPAAKIFMASDALVADAAAGGADGFVSALANLCPRAVVATWRGACELQAGVKAARDALKSAGGIPAMKALLAERYRCSGASRIPAAPHLERLPDLRNAVAAVESLAG